MVLLDALSGLFQPKRLYDSTRSWICGAEKRPPPPSQPRPAAAPGLLRNMAVTALRRLPASAAGSRDPAAPGGPRRAAPRRSGLSSLLTLSGPLGSRLRRGDSPGPAGVSGGPGPTLPKGRATSCGRVGPRAEGPAAIEALRDFSSSPTINAAPASSPQVPCRLKHCVIP